MCGDLYGLSGMGDLTSGVLAAACLPGAGFLALDPRIPVSFAISYKGQAIQIVMTIPLLILPR